MGNGYGSHVSTREKDMAAYDSLPPLVRRALQYLVADWSSEWCHKQLRQIRNHPQFPQPEKALILAMRDSEKADTAKHYGPRHPEALPKTARKKHDRR